MYTLSHIGGHINKCTMNLIHKDIRAMITYHNDLNKVSFTNLSNSELNIFFTICSIMKDKGLDKIEISFSDFKKITGIKPKDKKDFVKIINRTYMKLLQISTSYRNKDKFGGFVLFNKFEGDLDKETISIKVNEEFIYILNELVNNFTAFELQEFNSLTSAYSKHMFRLLKQYKTTGYLKISVEEFRRLLDVPESYDMRNINLKVLSKIQKELPSYFKDLRIEKIKDGRVIKYFEFHFKPQYQEHGAAETPYIDITPERQGVILCPSCGKELMEIKTKDGNTFYGHKNFKTGSCKLTFNSLDDIETYEKKIKLEKEQHAECEIIAEEFIKRQKLVNEIKALCKSHSDKLVLIEATNKYVLIDHLSLSEDYNRPIIRYKLSEETLAELKRMVE